MQNFEYNFNIGGNYSAEINEMTTSTGKFTAKVNGALNTVTQYAGKLAVLDLVSSYTEKFNSALGGLSEGGIALDSQMHDLSAVAGVTGDTLKEIESYARSSAKAFGTDAGVAVEGYKLLLSQLTPELAKCPEALQKMGTSIQTTSKLMGNDGTAAAEVLTTAMNQYGVSLDDPIAASEKMAEMMNIMADYGHAVGAAFSKAYNEEMKTGSKETKKDGPKGGPQTSDIVAPVIDPTGGTAGTLTSTGGSSSDSDSGGGKVRNVTINVGALVGRLEIHSQRLKEGADEMKDAVAQALLSALNDTNLATE